MDLEPDTPSTSSWSLRHPEKPIIAPRPTQTAPSEARKASNRVKQQQRQDTNDALTAHLSENAATQNTFIIDTAKTFNLTPKYIKGLMTSKSMHKSARAASWQNAMVHHKSLEVNEGLEEGRKKKLSEIQALIAEDTDLQNSSEAQKKELIAKVTLHRKTSKQGARFNNAAAAADFRGTLKKSLEEFDNLKERTGAYTFAFSTRSHIHDTFQASWIDSKGAIDFTTEVLGMSKADIAQKFELWAIARENGLTPIETLSTLRTDCTTLIINGLSAILCRQGIAMSYTRYDVDIVQKLHVKLVGWPAGIPFASPSLIGTVGDVKILREALQTQECMWVSLSQRQRVEHSAKLAAMAAAGTPSIKKRKQRSDKGYKRGKKTMASQDNEGQNEVDVGLVEQGPSRKRQKTMTEAPPPGPSSVKKMLPPMYKSHEFIPSDSDSD